MENSNAKVDTEIGYIVFCGLNHLIQSWIDDGHCHGFNNITIEDLEEMVDYYCNRYYISGIYLKDKLSTLKGMVI